MSIFGGSTTAYYVLQWKDREGAFFCTYPQNTSTICEEPALVTFSWEAKQYLDLLAFSLCKNFETPNCHKLLHSKHTQVASKPFHSHQTFLCRGPLCDVPDPDCFILCSAQSSVYGGDGSCPSMLSHFPAHRLRTGHPVMRLYIYHSHTHAGIIYDLLMCIIIHWWCIAN